MFCILSKTELRGQSTKKPSLEVFCKTINTEDSIICSFPTLLPTTTTVNLGFILTKTYLLAETNFLMFSPKLCSKIYKKKCKIWDDVDS